MGDPDYVRILNNAVGKDTMPMVAKAINYPMNAFREIKVAASAFHPQFIVAADLAEGAGSVADLIGSTLIGDKAAMKMSAGQIKKLFGQPRKVICMDQRR